MNYIVRGLADLKYSIGIGCLIYAILFLIMYAFKKRKEISWKCISELIFCIYGVLLLKQVGIFSLHFSFNGIMSYNIIPFIGSSFVPVVLNFILFVPYGFLLPVVFSSCKWNWKRILCVGSLTSLTIELMQMFGGRYAEIDDFLINALGALTGYFFYACLLNFRKNKKKTISSLVVLTITLVVCFSGIYYVGDNSEQQPDGFSAVESNISVIQIYYNGESQVIPVDSYVYRYFVTQISNCGGHLLEIENNLDGDVTNNKDCFMEILFTEPQNISFENAKDLSISDADRVMYNASKNILYWGFSSYQYYVDYTRLDAQLEENKADILAQYQELQKLIAQHFE